MGSKDISQEESPFPLTEVDKWVLSQTDEEFQLHTWVELKDIICKLKYSCYSTNYLYIVCLICVFGVLL